MTGRDACHLASIGQRLYWIEQSARANANQFQGTVALNTQKIAPSLMFSPACCGRERETGAGGDLSSGATPYSAT